MATYHLCDICNEDLPTAEDMQFFIQIGPKKAMRDKHIVAPGIIDIPHINLEVCESCDQKVRNHIFTMQKKTLCK